MSVIERVSLGRLTLAFLETTVRQRLPAEAICPQSPGHADPEHTHLPPSNTLPKEEAKGSHLSQVHSKDTADLLEGKDFLLLVPSGALRLPIILLELGTGVEAGGRAGGAGHAVVTCVPADRRKKAPKTSAKDRGTGSSHGCSTLRIFGQSSGSGIQGRSKPT